MLEIVQNKLRPLLFLSYDLYQFLCSASDVSCGGISYSKLFMDLSTAREELNTAQVANAQYKQEVHIYKGYPIFTSII